MRTITTAARATSDTLLVGERQVQARISGRWYGAAMNRIVSIAGAAALAFSGFAAVTAAQPAAQMWEIGPFVQGQNKSVGMPTSMTPSRDGPYFDFPYPTARAGHVHYVTVPVRSLEGARKITLTYRIDAQRGTRFIPQENPAETATLSLYFQRAGDRWTRKYPLHRWYAPANRQMTLRPGTHRVSIALDEPWTSVLGGQTPQSQQQGFAAALRDTQRVGFVLGSGSGRGHGVYATAPARFTILDFEIE